jgi:uncharacterized protein YjbI with pentapeptide repeats
MGRLSNHSGAHLSGANLSSTFLQDDYMRDTKISSEQLATALSINGATMPDGTIHD